MMLTTIMIKCIRLRLVDVKSTIQKTLAVLYAHPDAGTCVQLKIISG